MKKRQNMYCDKFPRTREIPLKDGNRETIMQWLYDINLVEWYVTFLMHKTTDESIVKDYIQEMWVEIGEIPQKRWDDLYRQGYLAVASFVTGVIHQQIVSKNSHLYQKYGKYKAFNVTQDEEFWKRIYDEYEGEEQ